MFEFAPSTREAMSRQITLKAVSSRFLVRLRGQNRDDDDDLCSWPCPHVFYHSVQHFIGHLLWALHPDRSCRYRKDRAQMDVIMRFLNERRLCNLCRISIFSEFDVDDLYKTFGVGIGNSRHKCPTRCRLCFRFWTQLFHYPPVPRFIIKSCSNEIFKYLCSMMEWMLERLLQFNDVQSETFESGLLVHGTMMFRSIKYWKLKDLLYYLRNHADKVMSLITEFDSLRVKEGTLSYRGTIIPNLLCVVGKAAFKSAPMGCLQMSPEDVSEVVKYEDAIDYYRFERQRGEITRWMNLFRRNLLCEFVGCSKPQKDIVERFKLCGGCKMVYYCSRSCQKRAWPQHKAYCKILTSRLAP